MRMRGRYLSWLFLVAVAASGSGIGNKPASAGDIPKAGGGSSAPKVWPEGADLESIIGSTTNSISSAAGPILAPPRNAPLTANAFNFDFKTDHEVDVRKFMPPDTQQRRLFDNTIPLGGTPVAKKSIPFLGLSVTRSLN